MEIASMLTGHELFGSLLPDQVEKVTRFSASRKMKKGEVVHEFDGKATHVFTLLEGEVQLRLPTGEGEGGVLVSRVGKGEIFGIAPLLGSKRYTTTAVCMGPSKVLFVEAKPLLALLRTNPVVDRQVMSVVARAYFDRYVSLEARVRQAFTDLVCE